MENKTMKNDMQSFEMLAQERAREEQLEQLFVKAAGEEDVSRREANVKHFDLGGNRHQAVIFPSPVHFRESEDAPWQEIDNTLEETVNAQGRAVLKNRANRVRVEFPQQADGGSMASITDGSQTFAWRFEREVQPVRARVRGGMELKQERLVRQAQRMAKFAGRTVESLRMADLSAEIETEQEKRADIAALCAENLYENVLPGVSVRYTLGGESVKEDVILANAAALASAAIRLPKDFDYQVTEDQQVRVLDRQTGEERFIMNAPVVYDAAENETLAEVALTDCGEYVRLTYDIDPAFMDQAVFPVTIDPVVHSSNPLNNIQDTTLCQNKTLRPYDQDHLRVGRTSGIGCVGLLKFNTLAIPKSCDMVTSAVLQMTVKSSAASRYIGAYEVLKPWSQTAVDWMNFNPDNTANVAFDALECVPGASSGKLSFDLTSLYRKWCTCNEAGVSNNNGVAFRTPANVSGDNYSELYSANASSSANRPVMYVNYISHAGLEGWWQFEQMSAGRAGTAHVDLCTGNMVAVHSDTVMTGNRSPVSVNHYYNSSLSYKNDYNCGYGWKTDAHQKVTMLKLNNINYLVWEDGDGTEHFFAWTGSAPYKDLEGMDLKLSFSADGKKIHIYDKEDNGLQFNIIRNGLAWLESTSDACGNTVTYSYVSGHEAEGRLDKITDPAGRITQFAYNADGLISSIRIPDGSDGAYRYVYYTYDGGKRLTGVRYSELGGSAAHTAYLYDGSGYLLTGMRNYDGVQVNIGYEAGSLYDTNDKDQNRRALSMETVATSAGTVTKYGAKQMFTYRNMCTEVKAVETATSNAGKTLYYQFNASGNVICVRDDLGYARFTKFDSGIENRPSGESTLRRAVVNLLRHTDLSANWTATGAAAKDTAATCMGLASVKLTAVRGSESCYRQEVTLAANTKYTFSAYVRTKDITGRLGAHLRMRKMPEGFEYNYYSDNLYGTTTAAVGNGLATDGWERLSLTLDHRASVDETYSMDLVNAGDSGDAWFACPQLETGSIMNTVNLLSNSDFRLCAASGSQMLPTDWSKAANTLSGGKTGVFSRTADSTFPAALSGNYLAVEGAPNKTSFVGFMQTVNVSGKSGDVFTLGGWVDSHSVPLGNNTSRLAILMRVKKPDGKWTNYVPHSFNTQWVGWQFGCFAITAPADYTQVELTICYISNCNVSKFTNLFLYREAFGESFAYDSEKNLISTSTLAGQKSDIKYDAAKNIAYYTQPGRDSSVQDNQHWFYYGDTMEEKKMHLLWRSRTPMHTTDYYSYDRYGNTTASRRVDYRVYTQSTTDAAYPFIRTETAYDSTGNYAVSTKDARGNVVTQNVNAKDGTLASVTDPTGQTVNYTYDAAKRVTGVQTTGDGKTYRNAYTYDKDRIKTVSHNTTGDAADVTYAFDYDELGRKTTVKVGSQTLSANVYEDSRNGLLSQVQYGNGGKAEYIYDGFDRLKAVRYDGELTDRYAYEYGANGQVAEVQDNELYRTARTDYDLAGRPCQTELHQEAEDGKTLLYRTRLKYDKLNHLEMFTEEVGGETHKTQYAYDRDNRVTDITYDGDNAGKISYVYDELGRLRTRTISGQTGTYYYEDGGYSANSSSPLVALINQPKISFRYAYDTRGNIVSEQRGNLTTTYAYDALGQLVRVNDPHENATWVYNYDRGGNITSKVKYAYTTGALGAAVQTIPYTYGDSNWKDKLTSYNGQTITYDAIGNPLNDGTWTYTWQAGRQLQQMNKEGSFVSFKYDHNGLRTEKMVGENGVYTITSYTLHGKLITHMTVGEDKLHFFYDAQSRPAKVNFNGTVYTYLHNLQGDVVGILDNAGNLVVEYKYDAWGRPLSATGSLAGTLGKRNPFRYRGYVYDEETGLYYLRSRYYNAEYSRFINEDIFVGVGNGLVSHNQYAYSLNSPVCKMDSSGFGPYMQTLKEYAYVISNADGTLPFGDMLVIGLFGTALLMDGINRIANSWTNTNIKTEAKEETRQDESKTYIYRRASGTPMSLTPRVIDTNGLSFSTIQPTSGKYVKTTMEKVNATGVLTATFDPKNLTHVLVNPIDLSTLQEWIDSRETANTNPHAYTTLLITLLE